jgi:hypothetical protein
MKFYSITRNGKALGRFPEPAFREMIKHRLLPPDALYWTDGMADWVAVASLSDATAPQPKPQAARRTAPPAPPTKAVDTDDGALGPQLFRFFLGVGAVALVTLCIIVLWSKFDQSDIPAAGPTPAKAGPTPPKTGPRLPTSQTSAKPASAPIASQSKPEFAPHNFFGKEIFAAFELAVVNFENEEEPENPADGPKLAENFGDGAIGVALRDVRKGERYIVEVHGDRFLQPSRMELTIEKDAKVVIATPKEVFDFEALAKLKQAMPTNIYFTVQKNNLPPETKTETFRVRPPNDCPIRMSYYQLDAAGNVLIEGYDSAFVLAGFVNETHPWIDQILKSAKRYSRSGTFTGYQAGNAAIREQVAAIWKTLQSHNITYSSITATSGSREHLVQHVRFLDETIANEQANCVDGTVALCSILQKIGLNTGIAIVPGHAYLVVYDEKNEEPLFGVETTMLAGSSIDEAVSATRRGPYALPKVLKAVEEGQEGYALVNIGDARSTNINPIPYSR